MTWMTSSMSRIAMSRPSTRCSRSSRLREAVLGAAAHDVGAEVDVDLEQVLEAHGARLALDERHVVDAEVLLHRRQLVELLEDGLGVEAVLDLDDEPQAVLAVGEVLEVGDALQLLALDEVLDLVDDLLGTDEVGQLGDDDALAARGDRLDARGGAGAEAAPAGEVGVADALEADDLAAAGRSGPGTNFMRSSSEHVGLAMRCRAAPMTSTRLCGAMFVAMPTAMPAAPLTSRLG